MPLTVKISVDTSPILQLDKAEENVSLLTPEVVWFHGTFTLDPVPEIHYSSPVWGPLCSTLTSQGFLMFLSTFFIPQSVSLPFLRYQAGGNSGPRPIKGSHSEKTTKNQSLCPDLESLLWGRYLSMKPGTSVEVTSTKSGQRGSECL